MCPSPIHSLPHYQHPSPGWSICHNRWTTVDTALSGKVHSWLWVHSWWCTLHGFGQIPNDMSPYGNIQSIFTAHASLLLPWAWFSFWCLISACLCFGPLLACLCVREAFLYWSSQRGQSPVQQALGHINTSYILFLFELLLEQCLPPLWDRKLLEGREPRLFASSQPCIPSTELTACTQHTLLEHLVTKQMLCSRWFLYASEVQDPRVCLAPPPFRYTRFHVIHSASHVHYSGTRRAITWQYFPMWECLQHAWLGLSDRYDGEN